ncbi:hypothetical protein SLEP1_g11377 [Rubroshorea leprosula]|uniref:Uncharacterized protein n=1 Tax=Rubroshorea leprosula TaxID=152421 RepID=A0AAV5IMI1_9ROSI|nr:hypothetical protein SLEP1_g11377 [Rubroshorea leprosula]
MGTLCGALCPWLTYWWNTQKWFPASSVVAHSTDVLSRHDKELIPKLSARKEYVVQVRQQGEYESLHCDIIVGFGNWEFDPMSLENPFPTMRVLSTFGMGMKMRRCL